MITSKQIYTILRILLFIINAIFILLGLTLVVTTSVLRWGNIINISSLQELNDIQNVDLILNGIPISLIVYGVIVLLIGVLGLLGVWTCNKFLLIIHEIIVIIIFLVHLGAVIAILVAWPSIESQFQKELNKTLEEINNKADIFNFSELISLQKQCNLLLETSKKYDCCGIMSPSDFNFLIRLNCCKLPTPKQGCLELMIRRTKEYSLILIVIPMSVIILMVILSIILVPILIYLIRNKINSF